MLVNIYLEPELTKILRTIVRIKKQIKRNEIPFLFQLHTKSFFNKKYSKKLCF